MVSDEDFTSFSPPNALSPSLHFRRLKKRLKQSSPKISQEKFPESVDPLFLQVDFAKLEALENDSEHQYFNESNSPKDTDLSRESLSREIENEVEMELDPDSEVSNAKRVLDFNTEPVANEENNKFINMEKSGNDTINSGCLFEEKIKKSKKKKNREKGDICNDSKTNERASNKRREENERKAYLKELHAESQRLLRETRDASFRPVPVVEKPISSILEKIRKRKLEFTKKSTLVKDVPRGRGEDRVEQIEAMIVEKNVSNIGDDDEAEQTINENDQNKPVNNEQPIPALRAPVEDTQDLFDDSEPNVQNDERSVPLKEDHAPCLLAMNFNFESAPLDDSSSEEEYNEKENVDPQPHGQRDGNSSPNRDPVKDFVDEEAEEEDDSDNDLNRFQENEAADDIDDLEELNDIIASESEERSIDKTRRDELHQKWLEQQDAAGTDQLMQRLNCGSELKDVFGSDNESETDDDVEEHDQETGEDSMIRKPRVDIKKAKQIILESFHEKEDVYISDDDDGSLRRHARCFIRKEELSIAIPEDDANSKEVFGLIKKLNIASEIKKPKSLSIFDSVENRNNLSKPSFLGRASNHPLPLSRKQGSTTVRSFIFGRDDSNSRSSISMSEASSDSVSRESGSTRTTNINTAKYSRNSESKVKRDVATSSTTSLLDILKRSSSISQVCSNQNTGIDLTPTIFSFRAAKTTAKNQPRG